MQKIFLLTALLLALSSCKNLPNLDEFLTPTSPAEVAARLPYANQMLGRIFSPRAYETMINRTLQDAFNYAEDEEEYLCMQQIQAETYLATKKIFPYEKVFYKKSELFAKRFSITELQELEKYLRNPAFQRVAENPEYYRTKEGVEDLKRTFGNNPEVIQSVKEFKESEVGTKFLGIRVSHQSELMEWMDSVMEQNLVSFQDTLTKAAMAKCSNLPSEFPQGSMAL